MMTNKKLIIIISSAIIVIGIILISFYISKQKQITPSTPEVTIFTDKNGYDRDEIIRIIVKNVLDKSILYSGGGDRFWEIEYFKDDKWINPAYESNGGFQLTEENMGDNCFIALYERMPPSELKSQFNISSQWNQKICPFETGGPAEPRTVRYIESGEYRLIFNYGFEISDDDPFRLSEYKTVYSNTFTIK